MSTTTSSSNNNNSTTSGLFETVESYFGGSSTTPIYPSETLAPMDCADRMASDVQTYWNTLTAMLVLVVVMLIMPYLFCCCAQQRKWRFISWMYVLAGWIKIICGILLSTALLPDCPLECGAFFCGLHEYNPGPLYGAIVVLIGLLWLVKACTLRIKGKRAEIKAKEAQIMAAEEGYSAGKHSVKGKNNYKDNNKDNEMEEEDLNMAEIL